VNVFVMKLVDIMATEVNICGISLQDGEILYRSYKIISMTINKLSFLDNNNSSNFKTQNYFR